MIYLASDHAGYELKEIIINYLKSKNIKFEDIGPFEYDALDDYPDFIIPCAEKVASDLENNLWIVLWWSGQWEAIAANKVKWIRAVVYYWGPKDIIQLWKVHNNANILSLWARFIDKKDIPDIIDLWLSTKFENKERHVRRINKILDFEK